MRHSYDDVESLFRGLDPAVQAPPIATAERRERDRAAILSTGMVLAPPPGRRGRLVTRRLALSAMGLTAAGVVGATVGVTVLVDRSAPEAVSASTPEPLAYQAPPPGASAVAELDRIADRTGRLPAERGTGSQHIKVSAWYLDVMAGRGEVHSLVVPRLTETWRAPDGTGTETIEVEAWKKLGRPGGEKTVTTLPPAVGWDRPAPAEPAAMATFLSIGHPVENGPAETIVAATDLVREQVLGPAQRAALLRVLATVPGLVYEGTTKDRAGRAGHAFSLRNAHGGLANVKTVIVDPATGRLLARETLLLEAGALTVRVPAVVDYEIYVTSEFADPPR